MYDAEYRKQLNETVARESAHLWADSKTAQSSKGASANANSKKSSGGKG